MTKRMLQPPQEKGIVEQMDEIGNGWLYPEYERLKKETDCCVLCKLSNFPVCDCKAKKWLMDMMLTTSDLRQNEVRVQAKRPPPPKICVEINALPQVAYGSVVTNGPRWFYQGKAFSGVRVYYREKDKEITIQGVSHFPKEVPPAPSSPDDVVFHIGSYRFDIGNMEFNKGYMASQYVYENCLVPEVRAANAYLPIPRWRTGKGADLHDGMGTCHIKTDGYWMLVSPCRGNLYQYGARYLEKSDAKRNQWHSGVTAFFSYYKAINFLQPILDTGVHVMIRTDHDLVLMYRGHHFSYFSVEDWSLASFCATFLDSFKRRSWLTIKTVTNVLYPDPSWLDHFLWYSFDGLTCVGRFLIDGVEDRAFLNWLYRGGIGPYRLLSSSSLPDFISRNQNFILVYAQDHVKSSLLVTSRFSWTLHDSLVIDSQKARFYACMFASSRFSLDASKLSPFYSCKCGLLDIMIRQSLMVDCNLHGHYSLANPDPQSLLFGLPTS